MKNPAPKGAIGGDMFSGTWGTNQYFETIYYKAELIDNGKGKVKVADINASLQQDMAQIFSDTVIFQRKEMFVEMLQEMKNDPESMKEAFSISVMHLSSKMFQAICLI